MAVTTLTPRGASSILSVSEIAVVADFELLYIPMRFESAYVDCKKVLEYILTRPCENQLA